MGAAKTHAILAGMRGLVDRLEDDPAVKQLTDLYGAMTEQEQEALHAFDEAYFERPEDLARLGLKHSARSLSNDDDHARRRWPCRAEPMLGYVSISAGTPAAPPDPHPPA